MAERYYDKPRSNSVKHIPKDAQVIMSILKDLNVTEYEPRVINQLLEFTYRYVTCILDDAKVYANHAKKKVIELDDVKLACQMTLEKAFTTPPPREVLLELGRQKNINPLPSIKVHCGLRLPPERHCLLSVNYKLRASEIQAKKLTKSALDRGAPNRKSSATAFKRQSVFPPKTHNVAIPKPVFKFSGSSKSNGINANVKVPPVPVQKIKLEQDIKMEMDDDYMDDHDIPSFKRKREDDDDDDFETVGY